MSNFCPVNPQKDISHGNLKNGLFSALNRQDALMRSAMPTLCWGHRCLTLLVIIPSTDQSPPCHCLVIGTWTQPWPLSLQNKGGWMMLWFLPALSLHQPTIQARPGWVWLVPGPFLGTRTHMNSCLVLLRPWLAQCKLLKKQFFFWKTSLPSTEFLKVNQKIQPSPYLSITATADLELFLVFSASSLGFILSHPDPIQSSLLTAPAMQPSFSPPYTPLAPRIQTLLLLFSH